MSQVNADRICRENAITSLFVMQNEYSMMERCFEKEVIPTCEELGIGFVAFSPMASGFLSGKYDQNSSYRGDEARRVITRFSRHNVAANQSLLGRYPLRGCCTKRTLSFPSLAWGQARASRRVLALLTWPYRKKGSKPLNRLLRAALFTEIARTKILPNCGRRIDEISVLPLISHP